MAWVVLAAVATAWPDRGDAQCAGAAVGCLIAVDVTNAIQGAATAISPTSIVVAVVDRAGGPLGMYEGTQPEVR
jgi:hypothetical protein